MKSHFYKYRLAQNKNNVSEWSDMSIRGLLFQWASTIKSNSARWSRTKRTLSSSHWKVTSEIAIMRWANVGKWLVWLVDGWRWHFNIGPTLGQQLFTNCNIVLVRPTLGQQLFTNCNIVLVRPMLGQQLFTNCHFVLAGPTLGQYCSPTIILSWLGQCWPNVVAPATVISVIYGLSQGTYSYNVN